MKRTGKKKPLTPGSVSGKSESYNNIACAYSWGERSGIQSKW